MCSRLADLHQKVRDSAFASDSAQLTSLASGGRGTARGTLGIILRTFRRLPGSGERTQSVVDLPQELLLRDRLRARETLRFDYVTAQKLGEIADGGQESKETKVCATDISVTFLRASHYDADPARYGVTLNTH